MVVVALCSIFLMVIIGTQGSWSERYSFPEPLGSAQQDQKEFDPPQLYTEVV